jgi:hypothetical protein
VALVKARELRNVIAELEVGNATKFTSSIAVALDDADVNVAVSEESEDEGNEGSEIEEQSAQETCRLQLAVVAANNAALELRGEADGHQTGDPTRVVQSRPKRQVTADEKAAEGLRRARWLWSWYVKKPAPLPSPWTTLRPNTRTTCGKHNIGAVIGYLRRRPSCGEYRKASSLEWAARLPSLVAPFVACVTQLSLRYSGKKPSHYHIQPSLWTKLFPFS